MSNNKEAENPLKKKPEIKELKDEEIKEAEARKTMEEKKVLVEEEGRKARNFVPLIRSENKLLNRNILKLALNKDSFHIDEDYTESCYTESCYTESCYTEDGSNDFLDNETRLINVIRDVAKQIGFPRAQIKLDSSSNKMNVILTLLSKDEIELAKKKWSELNAKVLRRIDTKTPISPLIRTENSMIKNDNILALELSAVLFNNDDYTESCYTESCYTESCYTEDADNILDYESRLMTVVQKIAKEMNFPETRFKLNTSAKRTNFVLTLLSRDNLAEAQEKWPEFTAKVLRRVGF